MACLNRATGPYTNRDGGPFSQTAVMSKPIRLESRLRILVLMTMEVFVLMVMVVRLGWRRLDCALNVILHRLQRIALATYHDLDPALRHASGESLAGPTGHERVNTVERMLPAVKLMK
jgi:hypothetical protein